MRTYLSDPMINALDTACDEQEQLRRLVARVETAICRSRHRIRAAFPEPRNRKRALLSFLRRELTRTRPRWAACAGEEVLKHVHVDALARCIWPDHRQSPRTARQRKR